MPLKSVLDNLDGVDKGLHSLYEKQADGKFYLGVEGMVPSTRLDEFRTNNIALKQQLEKFEGIDPKKYADMSARERAIAEKKLIDAGEIDKVVEQRVAAMKEENEKSIKGLTTERDTLSGKLSAVMIDSTVKSAAVTAGAVPTAIDDVVLRAKAVFSMDKEGNVVAKDVKGQVIYGKDGTTPLTITDWVKALKTQAPHLFEGMKGTGATGGRTGPNGVDTSKMSATQKIAAGFAAQGQ